MLNLNYNGNTADLGFGHLGNGITVYDRSRKILGDYLTVAHIDSSRKISYTQAPISEQQFIDIEEYAIKADPNISASQHNKVFTSRPV